MKEQQFYCDKIIKIEMLSLYRRCDKIIKYTCPTHQNLYLAVQPYNFVANRTITT